MTPIIIGHLRETLGKIDLHDTATTATNSIRESSQQSAKKLTSGMWTTGDAPHEAIQQPTRPITWVPESHGDAKTLPSSGVDYTYQAH